MMSLCNDERSMIDVTEQSAFRLRLDWIFGNQPFIVRGASYHFP